MLRHRACSRRFVRHPAAIPAIGLAAGISAGLLFHIPSNPGSHAHLACRAHRDCAASRCRRGGVPVAGLSPPGCCWEVAPTPIPEQLGCFSAVRAGGGAGSVPTVWRCNRAPPHRRVDRSDGRHPCRRGRIAFHRRRRASGSRRRAGWRRGRVGERSGFAMACGSSHSISCHPPQTEHLSESRYPTRSGSTRGAGRRSSDR